jgi:Ca-activated chloride channel family protein
LASSNFSMKTSVWFACLLSLLAATSSSFAAGLIIVDPASWPSPGPAPLPVPPPETGSRRPPIVRPPPPVRHYPFAPLDLVFHKSDVAIKDQVASVTIEQEFYNSNPQQLEGTFLFPVPRGAQIKKFTMEIGGKQVEAEVLSADKARQIYEDIVRRMRDPALMEYAGRDLIRVRIFPIEPHSRKRITLSYTQLLRADAGLVEFLYPLNTEKYSAKPIQSVSLKIDVETRRPLKTIYSPSHGVEIRRHGSNRATLGFEAKNVKPDTDFQMYFAPEDGDVGINLMTYKPGSDDGYFLLFASPGVVTGAKNIVPKDIAFILDTSGSMAGKKLDQAKKALQFCVENVNDGDRFEIMRFATEVEPLFTRLVDATKDNREKAAEVIKGLKPIGGTAIDDALKKALALRPEKSDRPFVVIFLTDGLPTVGVTQVDQIVASVDKNAGSTRVSCFGIGHDVNTHLLDRITESTRAASQYVLPEEDIEVKVSTFFTKIKEPVLANIKITFPDGVRTSKMYPSSLPDLFKGEQLILAGRYSRSGAGAVVIEGTANGAAKKLAEDVKFPDSAGDYDFIPRLWATRRVGYLLDEIRLHGENRELKDEITDLARQFGIVTPYTAYLIVEDEKQRGVPLASQSLPQLQTDRFARDAAEGALQHYYRQRSGGGAIANARSGLALKSADAPADALALGNLEARRSLSLSAPAGPADAGSRGRGGFGAGAAGAESLAVGKTLERMDESIQQTRFVNGRNFFQNGAQWIDANLQKATNAPRVRIQFNSKEYFDLAAKQPEARPWLALGQNVQFLLNGQTYEVFE